MNCPTQSRRGFSLVEIVIGIGVLVVIAGLVFVALQPKTTSQPSSNVQRSETTRTVGSVSDVTAAAKELDQDSLDGQLDADLKALTTDLQSL